MDDGRLEEVRRWWRTGLVETGPGVVRVRGYPIEELVGQVGWAAVVWLVLRGELPRPWEERLLEAALVAGVDHGPLAPSIAIARMVATCGTSLGAAVAAGVCAIGDIHGGAAERCMELLYEVAKREEHGANRVQAVEDVLRPVSAERVPGYGHRVHRSADPRAVRLCRLVEEAAQAGQVSGRFLEIARQVETTLEIRKRRRVPLNVDGAVAVLLCELGFAPAAGKAVFILSRSVGIVAHALEQLAQGGRLKGPVPPSVGYEYEGPPPRHYALPGREGASPGSGEASGKAARRPR